MWQVTPRITPRRSRLFRCCRMAWPQGGGRGCLRRWLGRGGGLQYGHPHCCWWRPSYSRSSIWNMHVLGPAADLGVRAVRTLHRISSVTTAAFVIGTGTGVGCSGVRRSWRVWRTSLIDITDEILLKVLFDSGSAEWPRMDLGAFECRHQHFR
jgi:hypothetical protein